MPPWHGHGMPCGPSGLATPNVASMHATRLIGHFPGLSIHQSSSKLLSEARPAFYFPLPAVTRHGRHADHFMPHGIPLASLPLPSAGDASPLPLYWPFKLWTFTCSSGKLKDALAAFLKLSALLTASSELLRQLVASLPKGHKGSCAPPVCSQPPHLCCHRSCRRLRVVIAMRTSLRGAVALISLALLFPDHALSQGCAATSQNPHCDPSFANVICCPYPNVCYWENRQKTPGCCAVGQVCGVGGGGSITPQPVSTLLATQGNQPTATSTIGGGGVAETVTSGAVGVFSTIVGIDEIRSECIDLTLVDRQLEP